MQSLDGHLIYSATDLSNFLACPHLTLLNRRSALGGPKPRQFEDPGLEVLRRRGREHEQKFLDGPHPLTPSPFGRGGTAWKISDGNWFLL